MKIKTKLNLSIGLLFLLIILLAFLSIKQIYTLAGASRNIIKDNKQTVVYSTHMLSALSDIESDRKALMVFENYLLKQKANITESGEKELTESLSAAFEIFKKNPDDKNALANVRSTLYKIIELNLNAIESKNKLAADTADRAIWLISILSSFCIVIALILFIKLPGYITNPIRQLIKSIRYIAANDYSRRVNFEGHSELGELATAFNVMAGKLDEYNKSNISKILAEKKITETLLNKIQYPILGLDKNLKVIFVNSEFVKISGLYDKDILGTPFLEMAFENDLIKQLALMDPNRKISLNVGQSDTKIHLELPGKDIYYEKEIQEISYTPYDEKEKHLLGYVIILKNITKFVDMDLAKNKFIATISHELKTPISAIKLSLQLLKNEKTGSLNSEQHALVKSSEEDTAALLRIISELLNITQIETGNIQLNIRPASIKEIIAYAVNTNKPIAAQKNIALESLCGDDLPDVLADKEKTAWVLTNLISNAIRYSGNNTKITISVEHKASRQTVSVTDKGQGIDVQYKDRIFDRYFRVPGTQQEGTGLGLAISKEFIEAQGGQISVESTFGKGSTFSITLNNAL